MIDFLFSNHLPVKTKFQSFSDCFFDLLYEAEQLNIAVGYVTADSLVELKKIIEDNAKPKLNLSIGMHYFDGFTKLEYQAATDLNNFLKDNKLGIVKLTNTFRYHGKAYSFLNSSGPYAAILGSNNLSSIDEKNRIYEASVLINERSYAKQLNDFIMQISNNASVDLASCEISRFKQHNSLLENHHLVEKVTPQELADCCSNLKDIKFQIPLKASENHMKSNLNVFFGKGREDRRGLIKPRHWYEIEIIVPQEITSKRGYPEANTDKSVFDVITDDGWKFKCKVSGDYSKNFRSEGDLKILGKWIKGRLENAGVLRVGEPVTEETLRKYGRSNFTLIKTRVEGLWYLDFGVR